MDHFVITTSAEDTELLRALTKKANDSVELSEFNWITRSSKSSAIALCRSLLLSEEKSCILLLLDTNSNESEKEESSDYDSYFHEGSREYLQIIHFKPDLREELIKVYMTQLVDTTSANQSIKIRFPDNFESWVVQAKINLANDDLWAIANSIKPEYARKSLALGGFLTTIKKWKRT